jgi:hypothetical protein
MKNQNTHYRKTIPALIVAMVLGCFSLPAQADNPGNDRSIVGLWRVQYAGDVVFESFDQWFPGGLEFESANLGLGVLCQGTWKQMPHNVVELFHVNWNYDANGALVGYTYETQIDTVSHDRNSYQGTYDFKDYDVNGNLLSEETGTLTATRLTVN